MEIILYHGTSKKSLQNLLKDGILPWNLLGHHNWEMEEDFDGRFNPKKNCVYLGNLNKAKRYAKIIDNDNGIVLKVRVNINNLEPDEDSFKSNWRDSLIFSGTCAYHGTILPEQIKKIIKL